MNKAVDYRKILEKRRTRVYAAERDCVDALLYLMRRLEAEEMDIEAQINASKMYAGINEEES